MLLLNLLILRANLFPDRFIPKDQRIGMPVACPAFRALELVIVVAIWIARALRCLVFDVGVELLLVSYHFPLC